ncbi:MAG TPA: carboxypeptidase regulatory-like domain-containing protein [Gemmatimonadaceae bacterium]|nr:carboxypeptidase regulatory-like domain-containing protein [Gemmatimonadaceae bacterium]
MRVLLTTAIAAMVAVADAASLLAQSHRVLGKVATSDSTAVPMVAVQLDDAVTVTDSVGTFEFRGVAGGAHVLRARRLGFTPYSSVITTSDTADVTLRVTLDAVPRRLVRIEVAGHAMDVPFYLQDVYRRGLRGSGVFITREDIVARNPLHTRELLEGIPGIHVGENRIVFNRCSDAETGFGSTHPPVQVYIDGNRATMLSPDPNDAMELVNPVDIQAMEVYHGVSQIPAEFLNDACVVIAIWTRRR